MRQHWGAMIRTTYKDLMAGQKWNVIIWWLILNYDLWLEQWHKKATNEITCIGRIGISVTEEDCWDFFWGGGLHLYSFHDKKKRLSKVILLQIAQLKLSIFIQFGWFLHDTLFTNCGENPFHRCLVAPLSTSLIKLYNDNVIDVNLTKRLNLIWKLCSFKKQGELLSL